MTIGQEIDETMKRIKKARDKSYQVEKMNSHEAHKICQQFQQMIYEAFSNDPHVGDMVFHAFGYEISVTSLDVSFKKGKRSAIMGFSCELYEKYHGKYGHAEFHDDGFECYKAEGDEIILDEIFAIYPSMILDILKRHANRVEEEADKVEARKEVGLRAS